jgi:uncharacterized membrane protein YphA (DoxX/SURF4 family)
MDDERRPAKVTRNTISMTDVGLLPSAARNRTVVYWITTALVAAEFALGGVWDLLRIPYVRTILAHLGYPLYFAIFMGIWKLPGSVVLVLPRLPRLKEWVYAGMIFEMTGAVFSHLAVGDGPAEVAAPVILIVLIATSWLLRPARTILMLWRYQSVSITGEMLLARDPRMSGGCDAGDLGPWGAARPIRWA